MARAWALVSLVLIPLALAGCNSAGDPNPNARAPELLISSVEEGSLLELYVHSALGKHPYDSLTLQVDNVTVERRNMTYGIIHRIPATPSYLTVEATAGDTRYRYTGLLVTEPDAEGAEIVTFIDGAETERRTVSFPYTKLIERIDPE